jgi:pimeloyl-ACP methyl ester carboxylesterase
VPEDHGQPNGPRIKLAVAIFKSSADHPAPDPVVFLQGGPGLSVFANRPEIFLPDFYPLLAARDVILIEQRGVGLSQPALDCPEVDQVDADLLAQGLRGQTDPGPYLPAVQACRDRLVNAGVHLADYTTIQSAADVETLRQALGDPAWNLFGVSYGTRLALTVMRDFPTGVRSAVLDSPLPLQANIAVDRPAVVAAAFDTFFAACAADAACDHAYPNLKQVFYDTVDKLDQVPVVRGNGPKGQMTITGERFMAAVFDSLGSPQLPKAIYEARGGDFIHLIPFGAPDVGMTSTGLLYSVVCSEQVLPSPPAQLTEADNAYPQLHHLFSALQTRGLCRQWGVPAAPAMEQQAVSSAIPSLILSGRFDPQTPPAYGVETARTLPNSHLFTFPDLAHAVSHDPCAMTLIATFVDQPATAPSAECFAHRSGPAWEVPP